VVDIWRVDLGAAENDGLQENLCLAEHQRAAHIRGQRQRMRWVRSRGVLRALLGRYLDCDPRELRFWLGAHGKPALSDGPTARDGPTAETGPRDGLRFNLSHSGELMLVAVSTGREVGVDVERARERYTVEFLRAWTTHEATIKCRGLALAATAPPSSPEADLWITELDLGPQARGALAVEGGQHELRYRDYIPPVRTACSALAAKAPPGYPHSAPAPPFQI
jgi:phosphopantetheinyl transferase